MGQAILVNEQIDAGMEFVRDFNDYVSVTAAFWINPIDSDKWFLYVASDGIDDSNLDIAYGEVLSRVSRKKSQWLNPFQVKIVNSADPIARKVVEIRDSYVVKVPTRYNGSYIAGMSIGGAYIYPDLSAIKSTP